MVWSIDRVGSSEDNAAKEPSFAVLQKKVLDGRSRSTHKQLRIVIWNWMSGLTTGAGDKPA